MPFIKSIRKGRGVQQNNEAPIIHDIFDVKGGDQIYTAGGYTVHAFTTVGDSELAFNLKNKYKNNYKEAMQLVTELDLEYIIIAGGGSGGAEGSDQGGAGGGGGGGYLSGTLADQVVGDGPFPVSVGDGGTQRHGSSGNQGQRGGPSAFNNTPTTGGGGGGSYTNNGQPGGSGGGGGDATNSGNYATAGGGNGGAGGGGASGSSGNGRSATGQNGTNGLGGGGGGGQGGTPQYNGGNGGSGIVIIRWDTTSI